MENLGASMHRDEPTGPKVYAFLPKTTIEYEEAMGMYLKTKPRPESYRLRQPGLDPLREFISKKGQL